MYAFGLGWESCNVIIIIIRFRYNIIHQNELKKKKQSYFIWRPLQRDGHLFNFTANTSWWQSVNKKLNGHMFVSVKPCYDCIFISTWATTLININNKPDFALALEKVARNNMSYTRAHVQRELWSGFVEQNAKLWQYLSSIHMHPVLYPDPVSWHWKNFVHSVSIGVFTCILYCIPVLCPDPEWIAHVAIFPVYCYPVLHIMMSHTKLHAPNLTVSWRLCCFI